jgi:PIN domain nuclease of toxin-antitoxin system
MRLLLDTHCWLWLQTEPERFGAETLRLLEDELNELLLSAASSWEMSIKYALGKLPLPEPPEIYIPSRMAVSGTMGLPVEHAHALHVAKLPNHHGDPFDRMLIAQCSCEHLTLVTADPEIMQYGIDIVSV